MAWYKCRKGRGNFEPQPITTGIYGAEWSGTSDSSWTRTDDAANFSDPNPYYASMASTPSSPFDNIMPWSGMRRVEDSVAGTLVEIPKFYYKLTKTGTKMKLQISSSQQTGFSVSPAHSDRGDGKGERDYVYVGAYHCATSTYKSTTGVLPQRSITRANFRTNIHNLGSTIWQYDYAMYWTIMMLYLVEYADWNSQSKIGYGRSTSGSAMTMGYTDNISYHTGTTANSRTSYGGTKYRYIEGLWDNVMDWCDGIYFSGASVYGIKSPSNFSDTSGGVLLGSRVTSNGVIKEWNIPSASNYEYALLPLSVISDSTYASYTCDYYEYNSSGVNLQVGSSSYQGLGGGLFYIVGTARSSDYGSSVGSRIQKLP